MYPGLAGTSQEIKSDGNIKILNVYNFEKTFRGKGVIINFQKLLMTKITNFFKK